FGQAVELIEVSGVTEGVFGPPWGWEGERGFGVANAVGHETLPAIDRVRRVGATEVERRRGLHVSSVGVVRHGERRVESSGLAGNCQWLAVLANHDLQIEAGSI